MDNHLEKTIKSCVRTIAQSNPITATISKAWEEWETKKSTERMEELIANLLERMVALENKDPSKLKSGIESDEFPVLVEHVARKVKSVLDQEKRKILSQATYNAVFEDAENSTDFKICILDYLSELTRPDVLILKELLSRPRSVRHFIGRNNHVMLDHEKDDDHLSKVILSLTKLETRGLISRTESTAAVESTSPWKSVPHWGNNWINRWYGITPIGKSLVKMINPEECS